MAANILQFDFSPIGLAIKNARKAEGMTREELAELVGKTPRHIQAIENEGHFPSVELLIWLVIRFNISLDQFLFQSRNGVKSSTRRQTDAALDKLTDQELTIIQTIAKALPTIRSSESSSG